MTDTLRIAYATWISPSEGLVELTGDWHEGRPPRFELHPGNEILSVNKLAPHLFGLESGYFFSEGKLTFALDPAHYPWLAERDPEILVGGECNDWNPAADPERWRLRETFLDGCRVFALTFQDEPWFSTCWTEFKFVLADGRWLSPPDHAPNRAGNELWNMNLEIDPARTGHHRFVISTRHPVDLAEETRISGEGWGERHLVTPGEFFFRLGSDRPLGAIPENGATTFSLFAPRARAVEVRYFREPGGAGKQHRLALTRRDDGVWTGRVAQDLHGWYYWVFLSGASNRSVRFQPEFPVVDPYAPAMVGREGPGIILDRARLPAPVERFVSPQWQDLVIAELHVRDAVARAPIRLSDEERLGFTGLRKWVESDDFYLAKLGVNAVELQPVQEFDCATREEYHWGYMPVNYFSPESSYASQPERASQVGEFQDLVRAFHKRGMAVILDVVYNHVGVPNHLLLIDKEYYFELDAHGELLNWSGCGNDLHTDAAMALRLIIDSLVHLVEYYGIDGFRFDLAELIGVNALREIERRLKEVNPRVILIAEPWSFRGHIGRQLRRTGYASWNDGYRDFMRGFVRGYARPETVRFFLAGSPGALAAWPAQTVNYVESHDDRTWIDNITENEECNGFFPTENDRRRTHLMAAFLMSSIGIPMVAAGQDFLRSKHGVTNTYQRGDLNALDYERIARFPETHAYFSAWIRFRLSERGKLFRLWERPMDDYLSFSFAAEGTAFAAIFNADGSHGARRLLLAINPQMHEASLRLENAGECEWRKLADAERFSVEGIGVERFDGGRELRLSALDCGLWEAE